MEWLGGVGTHTVVQQQFDCIYTSIVHLKIPRRNARSVASLACGSSRYRLMGTDCFRRRPVS